MIVVAGSHWAFWKAVSPDNAFVSVNTCAQSESTCKATDEMHERLRYWSQYGRERVKTATSSICARFVSQKSSWGRPDVFLKIIVLPCLPSYLLDSRREKKAKSLFSHPNVMQDKYKTKRIIQARNMLERKMFCFR